MTIQALSMTVDAAEEALLRLAEHVPPGVPFGRPFLAMPGDDHGQIVVTAALGDAELCWFVSVAEVTRLMPLRSGEAELTTFARGQEISRTVGRLG